MSFPHAAAASLLNTALLLFCPPRTRRHFWPIEYPAQSTQVRTFSYHGDSIWSVTSSFLRGSPRIVAGDRLAAPAVHYPPLPPSPISTHRPRPADFVAIPAAALSQGDSASHMSAENVSRAGEAREHVAKIVLTFVSPVQLTLCLRTDPV